MIAWWVYCVHLLSPFFFDFKGGKESFDVSCGISTLRNVEGRLGPIRKKNSLNKKKKKQVFSPENENDGILRSLPPAEYNPSDLDPLRTLLLRRVYSASRSARAQVPRLRRSRTHGGSGNGAQRRPFWLGARPGRSRPRTARHIVFLDGARPGSGAVWAAPGWSASLFEHAAREQGI